MQKYYAVSYLIELDTLVARILAWSFLFVTRATFGISLRVAASYIDARD